MDTAVDISDWLSHLRLSWGCLGPKNGGSSFWFLMMGGWLMPIAALVVNLTILEVNAEMSFLEYDNRLVYYVNTSN